MLVVGFNAAGTLNLDGGSIYASSLSGGKGTASYNFNAGLLDAGSVGLRNASFGDGDTGNGTLTANVSSLTGLDITVASDGVLNVVTGRGAVAGEARRRRRRAGQPCRSDPAA